QTRPPHELGGQSKTVRTRMICSSPSRGRRSTSNRVDCGRWGSDDLRTDLVAFAGAAGRRARTRSQRACREVQRIEFDLRAEAHSMAARLGDELRVRNPLPLTAAAALARLPLQPLPLLPLRLTMLRLLQVTT